MTSLIDGEYTMLAKRGITEETCRKFGYKVGTLNGQPVQIAEYRDGNEVVAQHLRTKGKEFPWIGEKKRIGLFGDHLWGKGKKIIITEGEIDAMSVSQVQQNKWPVVSVPNGAKGAHKDIAANLNYLDGFEEVILMFDEDEPGRAAAQRCADVLAHRNVKIASLPLKDANECLTAGRGDEIITSIWNAKPYRPAQIVAGEDIWERLVNRPEVTCYPYPEEIFSGLNAKTYGIRFGELETWTSGSGMGKTTILKVLQHHFFASTGLNQAIIHLEEPLEDTAEDFLGIHIGKRLRLPDVRTQVSQEELRRAYEATFGIVDAHGNPRLVLYDHDMDLPEETLFNQIRYLHHAMGVRVFWLDHLSILTSGMGQDGDERRQIDAIMHGLKSLTQDLNIYIGLVVHLKKAQGTSFEEGGVPTLDDLRGSGGIKQLSNSVFAVSRDQQHPDEIARNTSLVTVLKCRFTGRTGPADFVLFDEKTGRLVPGSDPNEEAMFEDEAEGMF